MRIRWIVSICAAPCTVDVWNPIGNFLNATANTSELGKRQNAPEKPHQMIYERTRLILKDYNVLTCLVYLQRITYYVRVRTLAVMKTPILLRSNGIFRVRRWAHFVTLCRWNIRNKFRHYQRASFWLQEDNTAITDDKEDNVSDNTNDNGGAKLRIINLLPCNTAPAKTQNLRRKK